MKVLADELCEISTNGLGNGLFRDTFEFREMEKRMRSRAKRGGSVLYVDSKTWLYWLDLYMDVINVLEDEGFLVGIPDNNYEHITISW